MTDHRRWEKDGEGPQLMSFGLDFLTATFKDKGKMGMWVASLYKRGGEAPTGGRIRQFIGTWINGWFAGAAHQDGEFKLGLAQAIGQAANEALWVLKEIQPDGISRIDLQVTMCGIEIDLESMYVRLKGKGKNTTLITNSRGGQTLYIGSRASARFVRIYRKTDSRDGYEGWRFEVEFKKPLAREVWSRMTVPADAGGVLLSELGRIGDPGLLPFVAALRQYAEAGEDDSIKFPPRECKQSSYFWDKVARPWMAKMMQENRDAAEVNRIVQEAINLIQNTGHEHQLGQWAERELFGDMEEERWTEEPPWIV